MTTIVLLPGMDGSDRLFEPLVASAPHGVECVRIAYPPGDANRYEDLLPQVRAILPPEPFYLLGWSFSGPLALMLAAEQPAGLRGVILAASFVKAPIPWLPRWTRHLATPLLFSLYPLRWQLKALFGGYGTTMLHDMIRTAHARAGSRALVCRARAAMAVDARDALTQCPVPLLYLRSTEDSVIPPSRADEIRRIFPGLQVVEIPGPHLSLATNPRASWAALEEFIGAAGSP